jgi:uncharacterized protein (DUF2062 family)/2-polyprenyl-3-methyl-5-hydroxy-6-metoxy-1,4-benzoquinol methylase
MAVSVPNGDAQQHRRSSLVQRVRQFLTTALKEGLTPGRASAAVFVGVFVGTVPIYGFQSLLALTLAVVLKLNKPLTLAATFVNNPILQPFLVLGSVQLGQLFLRGSFLPLTLADMTALTLGALLSAWLVGSVALGALLGGVAAGAMFLFLWVRSPSDRLDRGRWRECSGFLNRLFAACPRFDRGFVRWKLRLDRIFHILMQGDLGRGPVVDLGCGHGIVLGLVAFQDQRRRLIGCDVNQHRIENARKALLRLNAELSVDDVRTFEFGEAGLILIIDVLQYLGAAEQLALLERCCSALLPGGRLMFRVHDRERGLASKLSLALDKLIFFLQGDRGNPVVLSAAEYRRLLEGAGMEVQERRFRNRLPLAHILFTAAKPAA